MNFREWCLMFVHMFLHPSSILVLILALFTAESYLAMLLFLVSEQVLSLLKNLGAISACEHHLQQQALPRS